MQKDIFYVYAHIVRTPFWIEGRFYDVGTVVYIGSGSRSRAFVKSGRTKTHAKYWNCLDKIILVKNLTVEDKFQHEYDAISHFSKFGYLFNKVTEHKPVKVIRPEDFRSFLCICKDSPSGLRWISLPNKARKIKIGQDAGTPSNRGYWFVDLHGIRYSSHRVVYSLFNNVVLDDQTLVVDHIDRDKSNNTPEKLRLVSVSENQRNKKRDFLKLSENSSGYENITWRNTTSPGYCFEIKVNGKKFSKTYSVKGIRRQTSLSFEDATEVSLLLALMDKIEFTICL